MSVLEPGRCCAAFPRRRASGGYVLVTVLAALALIAYMAGRFAERVSELRDQTAALRDDAAGRVQASSARAAATFWLATRATQPNGYGDGLQAHWRADGRWYRLGNGALVSVQDQRGLLSLNVPDRPALGRLLLAEGVPQTRLGRLLDVLEDYTDTDSLKRLNGAEAPAYREEGLPPPRNDWMLSTLELRQLPDWRGDIALADKVGRFTSTRRNQWFNPATSPAPVLSAMLPEASAEQIKQFVELRNKAAFVNGELAARSIGLRIDEESYIFLTSAELRISVWAPGLPRVLEYNVMLTPGALYGPWNLVESRSVSKELAGLVPDAAIDFPDPTFPYPGLAR